MKKDYDESIRTKNKYGEWVPAIPEPFFGFFGRVKCFTGDCHEVFRSREEYRAHYALKHILGL